MQDGQPNSVALEKFTQAYKNYYKYSKKGELYLYDQELNDSDIVDLCEFLKLHPDIKSLNISGNNIGVNGAIALVKNKTLISLNARGCKIDDAIAVILAQNNTLTSVDLGANKIGDDGAIALAKNASIVFLDLGFNEIGNDGVAALTANSILKSLILRRNKIHTPGVKGFADNDTLTLLDLRWNKVDDEGAEAIARSRSLKLLDLSGNKIGNAGAFALAKSDTLRSLKLMWNKIGAEGMTVFIKNESLTLLELDYNNVNHDNDKCTRVPSKVTLRVQLRHQIAMIASMLYLGHSEQNHYLSLLPLEMLVSIAAMAMSGERRFPNYIETFAIASRFFNISASYPRVQKATKTLSHQEIMSLLQREENMEAKMFCTDISEKMKNLAISFDDVAVDDQRGSSVCFRRL